jgi:hypothetical protein
MEIQKTFFTCRHPGREDLKCDTERRPSVFEGGICMRDFLAAQDANLRGPRLAPYVANPTFSAMSLVKTRRRLC